MIPIHILLELEEMLDLPWLMALQVTGGLFVARQSSLQQWCSTDSVALTPVVLAGSCCSTHGKSAALVYFILARFPSSTSSGLQLYCSAKQPEGDGGC
jgi:hypothetical protein